MAGPAAPGPVEGKEPEMANRKMPAAAGALALLLALPPASAARGEGGKRVIIDGVDRYRVTDPLFECVRVVLSHRGEKYSPAYVQGISGAAFRVAGPCPCAPTCSAAMDVTELIERLGYACEHLRLYGKGVDPARDVHKVVARVKAEVRAGRPALVWHAFTNAEWDVVCGYDETKKQFLGRGSYRGEKEYAAAAETRTATCLNICPAIGAILVGGKTGTFDARAAELDALAEAVRHAHRPAWPLAGSPAGSGAVWRFHEGLPCYDWWVDSFAKDPKRDASTGDRYCLGVYRTTHRAAADFLKELAGKYPKAKGRLERAAGHFRADADALDACRKLEGMTWGDQRKVPPDRNARAAALLRRARDAYARGIDEVEAALKLLDPERAARARRPAAVRRKDGKVWIRDVPMLNWDRRRQCTFAGALEAALKVTERPYDYAGLMGLTALAFRVRWCNDETRTTWCPSCAIGEMPDEQALAAKLTGWRLPMDWLEADRRDHDKLRRKIAASIDAGRPVVAYPPAWNVGVIYGYEDGGRTVLMRDYECDDETHRVPVEKLGAMQHYLGQRAEPPAPRECLREALRAAVRNWRRGRHDGGIKGREYFYGDAAFAAWIRDIGRFEKLPAKTRKQLRDLDAWNYLALHDARTAAGSFLRDWGRLLDGEAGEALRKAAEIYERQAKALEPLVKDRREAAGERDWSEAARQKEIEVLTEARKLDAAAIAEIEKALK